MFKTSALFFSLIMLMTFLSGCDDRKLPALGKLSGVVKLDGKPLQGATVQVNTAAGLVSTGITNKEGQYELFYKGNVKGVAVGNHTILITPPFAPIPNEANLEQEQLAVAIEKRRKENPVPMKFRDGSIKIEIKPGNNVFDFDMQSEKPTK